jgi:hypothetical protein
MSINQEREKRQHKMEKNDTIISRKHEMRCKIWEDKATTNPTIRYSEARVGHKQEGIAKKK